MKLKFIPLCFALLYASEPVNDIILYLINYFKTHHDYRNVILALKIISAGARNRQIIKFLNNILSQKLNKSTTKIIKFAMGLCNLGNGTLFISHKIADFRIINKKCLISLLGFVCLFMNETYAPSLEDFDCIFLSFACTVQFNHMCLLDTNLQLKKRRIFVSTVDNYIARKFSIFKCYATFVQVNNNNKKTLIDFRAKRLANGICVSNYLTDDVVRPIAEVFAPYEFSSNCDTSDSV
ncbi:hypothetical protein EDEG_00671 [Edhazardia aedis USNM 41457]|uniref:Uncharacterized protein n=1 Tax=Edhazardia aedis (strain USNM 41457) TaxID=1003232 RepID=J9DRR5_EDHAE|nr:hypothetical protein EDEG_00671 [Edhazardia aedis USNM 41457]|eukprot:EJW05260.1 hypothetical protein EDEG_00671 [Edhazardia aedis USNM 41457]